MRTADGPTVRVHSGAWRLVDVTDDGKTLRVQVGFGGCTSFERLEVDETPHSVHVVAVMKTTIVPPVSEQFGPPFLACSDALGLSIEAVHLVDPLGDRHLVGQCRGGPPPCAAFG